MSEVISLRSITSKIGSGATPKGGNTVYENSGIAFIRSQNVLDMSFSTQNLAYITNEQANKLNNVIVESNDILLNITGDSIARCTIVPDELLPARVNQHVSIIRCISPDYANYVCYYLQFLKPYLLQICKVGGTRNALTKEAIENLPIVIQEEYKKIGKLLSTIDQKIALNNQINEELEAMAKTLYDYWFVQFDFPDENGKPYKSSGGKMVYNDQLKREIPEGWGVEKLENIANITMGQSPKGTSYNEVGEGMLFFQGSTDFGWRFPVARQYTTEPSRIAEEDDILLSVRAPVGTLNIADTRCCIGRGLAAINSKVGANSYIFNVMQDFKKLFDMMNSVGTTFGSITKDDLYSLKLIYPPNELLMKFDKSVNSFDREIKNRSRQNQELSQLRYWLLPMLMNGQVKVEDKT